MFSLDSLRTEFKSQCLFTYVLEIEREENASIGHLHSIWHHQGQNREYKFHISRFVQHRYMFDQPLN